MQFWLAGTITGILLGLILFACVRLRMHFGPLVRKKYGDWARKVYWLVTILFMVFWANLSLKLLRIYVDNQLPTMENLLLEIWFALLALIIPLALIFKRINKNRKRG
jgi:hypothetical protein